MPRVTTTPAERAALHAHIRRALNAKPPRQMVLVQRAALEQLFAENVQLSKRLTQADQDLREADELLGEKLSTEAMEPDD
jgi:hypothetical protein